MSLMIKDNITMRMTKKYGKKLREFNEYKF